LTLNWSIWGAHISAEDFKKYFNDTYGDTIENYLRKEKISVYLNPLIPYAFVIIFLVLSMFFPQTQSIFSIVIGIFAILSLVFLRIREALQKLPNTLNKKHLVCYYLLKSADMYEKCTLEQKSGHSSQAKKFLEESINFLRECYILLGNIVTSLKKTEFNLLLTDQIERLRQNIKNRIYPKLKNQQVDNANILVTLAKFFYYEEEYPKFPEANSLIEQKLKYSSISDEDFLGTKNIINIIKTSRVLMGIIVLLIAISTTLLGVLIMRYPIYGVQGYWQYVSDNAINVLMVIATVFVGIYIPIFLKTKRE